jgi:hypothetical protein
MEHEGSLRRLPESRNCTISLNDLVKDDKNFSGDQPCQLVKNQRPENSCLTLHVLKLNYQSMHDILKQIWREKGVNLYSGFHWFLIGSTNGNLWTGGRNFGLYKDAIPRSVHKESTVPSTLYYEVSPLIKRCRNNLIKGWNMILRKFLGFGRRKLRELCITLMDHFLSVILIKGLRTFSEFPKSKSAALYPSCFIHS